MTNYSRSVLLSNGQIRGETLRNGTWPGGNIHPKRLGFPLSEQDSPDLFTHRHKRRNVRFKRLRRDTRHPSPEPRTQRLTRRNTGENEEPPLTGRLGCMESLWSGAVTPVFPPPFFQSSPTGSAFLPVSSPCCREPCALSCSQCAGMFQTDPIHYPVFPCR